MTKRFDGLASIATTVLLATVPCTASAQLVASVAAGPVAAQGSGIGYQGAASVRILIPRWSSELGLEGSFSAFDGTENRVETFGLVLTHSSRPFLWNATPYTVFGAGLYARQNFEPALGGSGGFGLRFPVSRVQPFAEFRLHVWKRRDWTRMTPLVFGIHF